jgi:hypothetical protein
VKRVRAWSIIKYNGETYIIIDFDHKNLAVNLRLWQWDFREEKRETHRLIMFIQETLGKGFYVPDLTISLDELDKCELLFLW